MLIVSDAFEHLFDSRLKVILSCMNRVLQQALEDQCSLLGQHLDDLHVLVLL